MKRIYLGREWQLVGLMGVVALGVAASGMTGCSGDDGADPSDDGGAGTGSSSGKPAPSSSGSPSSSSGGRPSSSGGGGSSSGDQGPPQLSGTPRLARANAFVTLQGTGFHASQGTSTVTAGGVAATVIAWSDGSIQVRAPETATGATDFVVTVDGFAMNASIRVLGRSEPVTAGTPTGPFAGAINAAGNVVTWGCAPGDAQGHKICAPDPVLGTPAGPATMLALGHMHLYAMHGEGLRGWDYTGKQLTPPPNLTALRAIAAGDRTNYVILEADGTAKTWTNPDPNADAGAVAKSPAPAFGGVAGVVALSTGRSYALALKDDGTVAAHKEQAMLDTPGSLDCGQATIPTGLTGVVAVAAGSSAAFALKEDGTVVSWGNTGCTTAQTGPAETVPADLAHVVAIEAGFAHALALKDDGTVVGWGSDSSQEISGPATLQGVLTISAGAGGSVVVTEDGKAHAWGQPSFPITDVPAGLVVKLP